MKKLLMFAAAMTIVGGAYAQDGCNPGDEDYGTTYCALVYNVSASLKTTIARSLNPTVCDAAVCYRDVGSMRVKGYLYICACDCEGEAFQNAVLTAWDSKGNVVAFENLIEWPILHRIGRTAQKVEALGNLEVGETDGFVLAGFGQYDNRNDRVSSISGLMIGVIEGPQCEVANLCEPSDYTPAVPVDLCFDIALTDVTETIAYGTFSIKYNSVASRRYAADDTYIYNLFPSFVGN